MAQPLDPELLVELWRAKALELAHAFGRYGQHWGNCKKNVSPEAVREGRAVACSCGLDPAKAQALCLPEDMVIPDVCTSPLEGE